MKPTIILTLLAVALATLCCVGTGFAEDTLQKFGDRQGRSYHADLYEEHSCDSCHVKAEPETFPPDYACLECHDRDELIESTARPEEEKWQNPHNNMHYGTIVPCMECHSEHKRGKPLCAGCHSFDYPKYKK